ncbi:MAG: hypothetical protein V2I33_03635 [Kangiellaceae bacterium]|jgi:thiol:disulfide interchange protein DsbA|nr:hypothetical protein [Kangiellaceae bacterium]
MITLAAYCVSKIDNKMTRISIILSVIYCFLAPAVAAQSSDNGQVSNQITEGVDYTVHPERLSTAAASEQSIDIMLVGYYGSESSARVLDALLLKQIDSPIQINIQLLPIVLRESWRPAAKLMMMANQLTDDLTAHKALFTEVQSGNLDWQNSQSTERLLQLISDDQALIEQTIYDSSLPKRLKSIENMLSEYPISSVPTIIFKGRYTIDANQAKTPARLMAIINHLENITLNDLVNNPSNSPAAFD